RPLPPPRRNRLRNHRVDDHAVLPDVRPEPADGGRDVVPLPLRPAGARPADAPPDRRVARGPPRADHRRAARAGRPGPRGPRGAGSPRGAGPDSGPWPGTPPPAAHAPELG